MTIQTKRLILRPFMDGDVNWYYDMVQDEELKLRLPSLEVNDFEQARNDVRVFEAGDFENDFYYVIMDKNQNVMGIIIAVRITGMTLDVSYFLKKEYRHNGYMSEALAELIEEARCENPVYRFRLIIEEDNEASLNVAKKFKSTFEKVENKYVYFI